MISTNYTLRLNPEEGETTIRISVDKTGEIKINVGIETDSKEVITSTFTFNSDMDVKALIETLKWARVKSLQSKGFKVVI